jgi:transposase
MGIDLGDKKSDVCRLNPNTGEMVRSRVAMVPEKVREHFESMERCKVVMEAGAQSRWFSEELEALGFDVIVTNPRRNALIAKSLSKNDQRDAALLADIATSSPRLLHAIHHRGQSAQVDLAIIRARDVTVRARTALANCARGIAKQFGIRFDAVSPSALSKLEIPQILAPALRPLFDQIAQMTKTIRSYDRLIVKVSKERYPETKKIAKIRGVGSLTALAFVLVLEDPKRFKKSRTVGAFLGLRPRQFESGAIRKQLGITKTGDRLMRRLLVQCAHYILGAFGEDCDLRRFGESIIRRGGKCAKKRACVAVARKLAVVMHRLWVDQSDYEPWRKTKPTTAA